jgi:hypothetical protein
MKKHLLSISLVALTFFSAQAQIPNPGFENWTVGGASNQYEDPDNWGISNFFYEGLDDLAGTSTPTSIVKDSPGHTGSYGVKMQNVVGTFPGFGVVDTLPGFTVSYTVDIDNNQLDGFVWNTRSAALTGYYKFHQGGTGVYPNIDTASIAVGLFKWNTTTLQSDSIGGGYLEIHIDQAGYASFSVPIYYLDGSSVPDSAIIFMTSSDAAKSFPNTYLIVDDVAFSGIATGVNNAAFPAGKAPYAFPNPAKDQINIGNVPTESTRIEVRDFTGRVVLTSTAVSNQTSFNLNGLKEGMYIYTILDDQGSVLYTEKFAVSK